MYFRSDEHRRAMFARLVGSRSNRFSANSLPDLGSAITESVIGAWPGENGVEAVQRPGVSISDVSGVSVVSHDLEASRDSAMVGRPLGEQFDYTIKDNMGESAIFNDMAGKVEFNDAAKLRSMAEQHEWAAETLVDMAPKYGVPSNVSIPHVQKAFHEESAELPEEITRSEVQSFGMGFSLNPELFPDIGPDQISKREELIGLGKNVAPPVTYEDFKHDWVELNGRGGLDDEGLDILVDDMYDSYVVSTAKSHVDFIRRLDVPDESEIPVGAILSEVTGEIPSERYMKVKRMVSIYPTDGGYVFVGSPTNVEKAERYVIKNG